MHTIIRTFASGTVIGLTSTAILLSQDLMHWMQFMPENIAISYYIYTALIAFVVGAAASLILSSQIDTQTQTIDLLNTNLDESKKSYAKGIASAFLRWFFYNIFGAVFATAWSIYLLIKYETNFLQNILAYGLIALVICNTLFLTNHALFKKSSKAEPMLLAIACAAAIYGCYNFFPSLSEVNTNLNTGFLIVGAIILGLIGFILIGALKNTNKIKPIKPRIQNSNLNNRLSPGAAIVCLVVGIFISGMTGIAITYSNREIETIHIIIAMIIIGALGIINFLSINNFPIRSQIIDTQAKADSVAPKPAGPKLDTSKTGKGACNTTTNDEKGSGKTETTIPKSEILN